MSVTDDVPDELDLRRLRVDARGRDQPFIAAARRRQRQGIITVTGITVPASSSVTVVFDVTVVAGTLPGALINNTPRVTNPNGPENNPAAPPSW